MIVFVCIVIITPVASSLFNLRTTNIEVTEINFETEHHVENLLDFCGSFWGVTGVIYVEGKIEDQNTTEREASWHIDYHKLIMNLWTSKNHQTLQKSWDVVTVELSWEHIEYLKV